MPDLYAPLDDADFDAAPTSKDTPKSAWVPMLPVPADAPRAIPPHRLGKSAARWPYHDANGNLLGLVVRFDNQDGSKDVLPLTYCRNVDTGEAAWRWLAFPKPRPLYGLDRLATNPAAPVLIVEGEKTADAAAKRFLDHVVVTSPGGSKAAGKADWSTLKGRAVTIWPDRDQPGNVFAADVAQLALTVGAASVRSVAVPADWPEGWDLADPPPPGVTGTDLHAMLDAAKPVKAAGGAEWPEPEPLTIPLALEAYPLDILPEMIRAAVTEVHGFVKAPVSMVACSALAALSIAAQAHVDVERAVKLVGPSSLYLLVVAESGERKSTTDCFFTTPIREWEMREAARLEPDVQAHRAALAAWKAKQDGIKEAIKAAAKSGADTTAAELDLHDLERLKPEAPRVPKMLRVDDTPEALAWLLGKEWPSAAVVSSEAGLVLGSHGMGRETIMRNLAQLNILWDGGTLSVGRRTSESFTVRDARLTVALQIQKPTLRAFIDGSKGLARGTGFLARFLLCWPNSTQGKRKFSEAPPAWPALSAFHQRIEVLLDTPVPTMNIGELAPTLLTLSPEAKAAWVAFHDALEEELREGGKLAEVRDVASKTADNAARLAALFHVLEHGIGGQVQADHMTAATRIAAWHLSEARRFFCEIALPERLADAVRVERFILDWCQREAADTVPRREVQRQGPVRDGDNLDAALAEMADAGRVRLFSEGKRKLVQVNPALLRESAHRAL